MESTSNKGFSRQTETIGLIAPSKGIIGADANAVRDRVPTEAGFSTSQIWSNDYFGVADYSAVTGRSWRSTRKV
jgi:hypothetical protein